jgi:hypothetical protein
MCEFTYSSSSLDIVSSGEIARTGRGKFPSCHAVHSSFFQFGVFPLTDLAMR